MSRITLPGLIDVHTHLRVPGGEHKEDFGSGTAAAVAGGITMILGMPNTSPPLATTAVLQTAGQLISTTAHCDVGLFAGASPPVIDQLPDLAGDAVALKIYLNDTFGDLRVDELPILQRCFAEWPRHLPIAMHAEKQSVAVGIGLAAVYQRPVHFCHISRREEIELIAQAKAAGLPVSCEVTPHHLFLDERDTAVLGPYGDMRPILGTPDDVAALWEHLNSTIDCLATDHAPHTRAEKLSPQPPPGVPGLQTSLPLLLTAVVEGRLTEERLVELMYHNPRRLFHLPEQPNTAVTVDLSAPYLVQHEQMYSKCGWTPFHGRELFGRVIHVQLRGQTIYEEGRFAPPSGRLITATDLTV